MKTRHLECQERKGVREKTRDIDKKEREQGEGRKTRGERQRDETRDIRREKG